MFIYNLVVRSYALLIWISSFRNQKAAQWINGRKNWRSNLKQTLNKLKPAKRVWVHCASYGEFEQGRPLIEAIKQKHPDYTIVLTFFSPSGYEAFKTWNGADVISYLPLDTKTNARDFIELVRPDLAIFIKYEFWVNYLFLLKEKNLPTYLVSAVFKPHHPFFKWYGGLFRRSLNTFTKLFIQDEASGALLKNIGISNYLVSGDTRFDRVLSVKSGLNSNPVIESFKAHSKLILAGSTWPADEDAVIAAFEKLKNKEVKLVLAPHEIGDKQIENTCKKLIQKRLTYTLYTGDTSKVANTDVLILNTIGVLAKSYAYANCAYIGGGFDNGIHNILEPSVFEIPVSFYGKDFHKFNEAVELTRLGTAVNIINTQQLESVFETHLFNEEVRAEVREKLSLYFTDKANVASSVLKAIEI